jgi:phenolic acid decarboxylase
VNSAAATRTTLNEVISAMIRNGGFLKGVTVKTASVGDNTYRVTLTPPTGYTWSDWQWIALTQVIEGSFYTIGGHPPRLTVIEKDRIVFRWFR